MARLRSFGCCFADAWYLGVRVALEQAPANQRRAWAEAFSVTKPAWRDGYLRIGRRAPAPWLLDEEERPTPKKRVKILA
jgi:hypothetical protein